MAEFLLDLEQIFEEEFMIVFVISLFVMQIGFLVFRMKGKKETWKYQMRRNIRFLWLFFLPFGLEMGIVTKSILCQDESCSIIVMVGNIIIWEFLLIISYIISLQVGMKYLDRLKQEKHDLNQ